MNHSLWQVFSPHGVEWNDTDHDVDSEPSSKGVETWVGSVVGAVVVCVSVLIVVRKNLEAIQVALGRIRESLGRLQAQLTTFGTPTRPPPSPPTGPTPPPRHWISDIPIANLTDQEMIEMQTRQITTRDLNGVHLYACVNPGAREPGRTWV